jgi:hypothetical protein
LKERAEAELKEKKLVI